MADGTHQVRLARSSVRFYFRSHLTVALGVLVGTATLTGALLVGDSMRGSLRDQALQRLGPIDYALVAPRFFREQLAGSPTFRRETALGATFGFAPLIVLPATAVNAQTHARAGRVQVFGVGPAFQAIFDETRLEGDGAAISESLAGELGITIGSEILLSVQVQPNVPLETLLGRRDGTNGSLRLTVRRILPQIGAGGFALRPQPGAPKNVFVPLTLLQRAAKQPGRVNAVVVSAMTSERRQTVGVADFDDLAFTPLTQLADYGLHIRVDDARGYFAWETDRLLLEPAAEVAAVAAAKALGQAPNSVLTYLVNEIAVSSQGTPSNGRSVPYSTATAIESTQGLSLAGDSPPKPLAQDEVLLNQWTAEDLGAKVGDRIRLKYYVSKPFGRLEEVETTLTLRGIVKMTGLGADPGLTPTYEGITNTKRITDWNQPFPMDMKRIRPKDEAYWNKYKAAPKVFVSLETGLKLWAEADPRYGRLTSIRIGPAPGLDLAATAKRFEEELLKRLKPEDFGLKFEPVRAQALAAAQGSTDFGMLFIGFSFFLIASAAMLVALLFRLGVERRAAQIGLLQALGWRRQQVARALLSEGAIVAAAGTVLGLFAAIAYAWLMLAGLRSWWAGAVHAPFLTLHVAPTSLAVGAACSFLIAMLSIAWSIRGLAKMPPRALLAGAIQSSEIITAGRPHRSGRIATVCFILAAAIALASFAIGRLPQTAAFFASGTLMLAACLAAMMRWMRADRRTIITRPGPAALARLGTRNAARHRGRSLLTAGLIACASFVMVAVGANRQAVEEDAYAKTGGTGGFRLIGESTAPLLYDPNRKDGRDALNLSAQTAAALSDATVTAFRLQPGDDASCLNLYRPRQPRLLGATPEMIARGGYIFSSSTADSPEERANPWRLLNRTFTDGAVPCIGDANTVQWLLHLGLGQDFVMTDERGSPLRLRIVGMLAGSVLQGELVISERDFVRHLPSVSGYRFFMIESPPDQAEKLSQLLERDLADHGLDLESTGRRLAEYLAVENTYLSAFQTLGGLGLLLGTFGLAAVMLRSILERRGELALMRALGFRQSSLAWMVFVENMLLLAAGLAAGTISALLAVAPHLISAAETVPWRSMAATLFAVLVVGGVVVAAALRPALRTPLLAALRRE